MSVDLLEDGFPHGSVEGYEAGCRGGWCPGRDDVGISCRDYFYRFSGDYRFRKRVNAGLSFAEIVVLDEEQAAAAVVAERATREAARAAQKPARVVKAERPQRATRRAHRATGAHPVTWRHGTIEGYSAGCFTASMCTASPSCEDANLVRLGLLAERKRSHHVKHSELPVEHGTLTMHRRGCRGGDCPASPSCADVAREFYSNRNKSMVRNVKGHGTNASFARGCRCEDCVEAHRQYHRDYWKGRRESVPVGQHGTAYGYALGCRRRDECPGGNDGVTCSDASLAEERRRRREQGIPERVLTDSAPVLAHLARLRARGLGPVSIAARAGVSKSFVSVLVYGRTGDRKGQVPAQVDPVKASKILAVQP